MDSYDAVSKMATVHQPATEIYHLPIQELPNTEPTHCYM